MEAGPSEPAFSMDEIEAAVDTLNANQIEAAMDALISSMGDDPMNDAFGDDAMNDALEDLDLSFTELVHSHNNALRQSHARRAASPEPWVKKPGEVTLPWLNATDPNINVPGVLTPLPDETPSRFRERYQDTYWFHVAPGGDQRRHREGAGEEDSSGRNFAMKRDADKWGSPAPFAAPSRGYLPRPPSPGNEAPEGHLLVGGTVPPPYTPYMVLDAQGNPNPNLYYPNNPNST